MKYKNKSTISHLFTFYLFVCILLVALLFFLPHSSIRKITFAFIILLLCLPLGYIGIVTNKLRWLFFFVFLFVSSEGILIFLYFTFRMQFPLPNPTNGIIGFAQYFGYPLNVDAIFVILICLFPFLSVLIANKLHEK